MKTLLIAAIALMLFSTAYSQPGTLDSIFGTNGKVSSGGKSIALQTDGKILLAVPDAKQIVIMRLAKKGKPDKTFGNNGVASTIFQSSFFWQSADEVIQKSDGKIIVAGHVYNGDIQNQYLGLACFKTNGMPDSSFGINGQVNVPIGQFVGEASGIILQPDGKFIVSILRDEFSSQRVTAIRFNADGSEDTYFEIGFSVHDLCNAIALQSDGKIVFTGSTYRDAFGDAFDLYRFNKNGVLDKSFGTKGITTLRNLAGKDLTIRPDNRIVAVTADSTLMQFQQNGFLDSSFGKNGRARVAFKCTSVVLQTDGKILVAGSKSNSSYRSFAVARYLSNGSLDRSFGVKGTTVTDFGFSTEALDIAIQTDNKILVTGNGGTERLNSGDNFSLLNKTAPVNSFSEIILKPNPATNYIIIEGLKQGGETQVEITDANGLIVYKQVCDATIFRYDISRLHQGNYFVYISSGSEIIKRSFIKE